MSNTNWSTEQDLNLRFYCFADSCVGPLRHRCINLLVDRGRIELPPKPCKGLVLPLSLTARNWSRTRDLNPHCLLPKQERYQVTPVRVLKFSTYSSTLDRISVLYLLCMYWWCVGHRGTKFSIRSSLWSSFIWWTAIILSSPQIIHSFLCCVKHKVW